MTPLSGPVLTAEAMRAAEATSGVPPRALMERAGDALADAVWRFGNGRPTLVLCGPGNNGGDGYVCARKLAARGLDVTVASFGDPRTEIALECRRDWQGTVISLEHAVSRPVVVDALFGNGLSRPLPDDVERALAHLCASSQFVIAADLPSGVRSDDGGLSSASRADVTIAFGAAKPAHLLQPAAARCGRILLADLGIPVSSDAWVLERPQLSSPGSGDHKYSRGLVLVVGGAMPGASALSAIATLRAGAGYVIGIDIDAAVPHAIVHRPAASLKETLGDYRVDAIVIGPGLGRDSVAAEKLAQVLGTSLPVVIDGDALIPSLPARAAPTIATPHEGEFVRMFGQLPGSKLDRAREGARRSGAVVVYKGADTVIAAPDGRAVLAPAGSPWLSTAGTGDVLAGIAGAMLARGMDVYDAACAAVWLHAEAARLAGPGLIADDLGHHLAALL